MNIIQERADRLNKIFPNSAGFPLLKCIDISPIWKTAIHGACLRYLYHNLITVYDHWFCTNLFNYLEELVNIPNITPNGMILPTKETINSYNYLHKLVAKVLPEHTVMAHNPITIRLVTGTQNPVLDRPRASTKIHSDIWAGEYTNSIVAIMPILGIDNVNIKFWEPYEEIKDYLNTYEEFDELKHLAKPEKEYLSKLENGNLYVFDPILLHQTNKVQEGYRLSLDFRFITDIKCESDVDINSGRFNNYICVDDWKNTNYSLTTERSIFDKPRLTKKAENNYPENYGVLIRD